MRVMVRCPQSFVYIVCAYICIYLTHMTCHCIYDVVLVLFACCLLQWFCYEQKNLTHVVYSLTMMSAQEVYANIVRDSAIRIEYGCVYPFIRTLSLGFPVHAISR